jgi:single-stranded-DNA-specific exonuclease
MNKQWQPAPTPSVSDELRQAVTIGIDPFGDDLVARTLVQRGITSAEEARAFLYPTHYTPASPYELPDMDKAISRIQEALTNGENILIWGDFDVDGQTATALWVSALTAIGGKVLHYIPNRAQGHGVHTPTLEKMLMGEWGNGFLPHLIITCDTGITAHDAVLLADKYGVTMMITDHHQLGETLPSAYAVINPQRLDETHPLRNLPGVGVVYKCVQALYITRGLDESTLAPFLDLVALGIVADVAVQKGDTRYLLQKGLAVLRETTRLGLQVMFEQAELNPAMLTEETIGFMIAPRLNSLGRLDDAGYAVEFLTTSDLERARILANRLEALNIERRLLSDQIFTAALEQTRTNSLLLDSPILVLGHEQWHGGVIGVVANRLVEHFGKPVILFTFGEGMARGSARSIDGLDITACIAECAPMLLKYGGHTMAAGLSLPLEKLPDFRREIARAVRQSLKLSDHPETPLLPIDAFIPLSALTLDFISAIDRLRPFGAGNPSLTLATERVTLRSFKRIGKSSEHLRITVEDEAGTVQDILWWRADADALPTTKFDVAYTVNITTYKGEKQITVQWSDFRVMEAELETVYTGKNTQFTDNRALSEGEAMAELILMDKEALIWNEGEAVMGVKSVKRYDLHPAKKLVIWTNPPNTHVLSDALKRVNPAEIVLFAVSPRADSVQGFITKLGGMVKKALSNGNSLILDHLAGDLAHGIETILAGLAWMEARGHITIESVIDGVVTCHEGGNKQPDQQTSTTTKLAHLLQEAAAYRGLFKTLDITKFPH